MRTVLFVILMCLGWLQPAFAADAGLDWMRLRVSEFVQRPPHDWNETQIASQMMSLFAAVSADGKRVTRADLEFSEKIVRTQAVQQMLMQIVQADIDGVGRVSRADMERVLKRRMANMQAEQREKQVQQQVTILFDTYDTDGDGVITLDEARQVATAQWDAGRGARGNDATAIPLSLGHDDIVTDDDFRSAIKSVFDEIDTDHNGSISQAEAMSYNKTVQDIRVREARAAQERMRASQEGLQLIRSLRSCGFPSPSATASLLVVGANAARAASTAVLGRDEIATGVVDLVIETGDKPLAILAWSREPVVWRLRGATQRLERFMATSSSGLGDETRPYIPRMNSEGTGNQPRVAVQGLDAAKVTFSRGSNCLQPTAARFEQTIGTVANALFKRSPEQIIYRETLGVLTLPSGQSDRSDDYPDRIATAQDGPASPVWQIFRDERPAGLVRIDPAQLVARVPVIRPDVLPGLAGLATLVEDGSLKVLSWRTQRRIGQTGPIIEGNLQIKGDTIVQTVPSVVEVTRKLRFPSGIPHSIIKTVISARGLPTPENLPQGACLMTEAPSNGPDAFQKVACALR